METYKGYRIEVLADTGAENPFKCWDGLPYLAAKHGREITEYGEGTRFPHLNQAQVRRHWRQMLDALEVYDPFLGRVRGFAPNLSGLFDFARLQGRDMPLWESLKECWEQVIGGNLEACAEAWQMAGVSALCTASRGYRQGDYAGLLLVATPKWMQKCGLEAVTPDYLKSGADLYAAWAWGDVYGYVITDPEGVEVDSLWGFYGADHEASGLMGEARANIDSMVAAAEKEALEVEYWQARGVETVAV